MPAVGSTVASSVALAGVVTRSRVILRGVGRRSGGVGRWVGGMRGKEGGINCTGLVIPCTGPHLIAGTLTESAAEHPLSWLVRVLRNVTELSMLLTMLI